MDIVVNRISKAFGDRPVFSHYSTTFYESAIVGIMAPSGSGKTTLLRLLLGLETPDSGQIKGVPKDVSVLFQEDRLSPDLSAVANIRLVTGRTVPQSEIRALLAELGLQGAMDQPVCQLSGGMARRVALARALLHSGSLLILDEPFTGLDEECRAAAADAILRYRKGRTLLFVTHRQEDLTLLKAGCLCTLK